MDAYLQSRKYDEKLLHDVLALDAEVYPQDFQGTFASVKPRFKAYPEMFIYRYDAENSLIGYVCFFPIIHSLASKIENSAYLYDDDITGNEIVKGPNNLYLVISIAVNEKYRQEKIATHLISEMLLTLKKNKRPLTIYAYTINQESYNLFSKFNFKTSKKINDKIRLLYLKLTE